VTDEEKIRFGVLHEDGSVTDEREIDKSSVRTCPFYIFVPEHYRADGSCRCDDPAHTEMSEWGYEWRDGAWRA